MTPAAAAQLAAESKFVVNTPVNAVTKGDGPEQENLAAIESFLKSKLAGNNRLASEGDSALTLNLEVTKWRLRGLYTRDLFGPLAGKAAICLGSDGAQFIGRGHGHTVGRDL